MIYTKQSSQRFFILLISGGIVLFLKHALHRGFGKAEEKIQENENALFLFGVAWTGQNRVTWKTPS
jgi:hypothetical protein